MVEKADIVLVGLGATGSILAAELTAAGAKVVALDKGPNYENEDWALKHDEIRYFTRKALVPHMKSDPITWRPDSRSKAKVLPWASGLVGVDPLHLPPSLGTGGGTIHWGAAYWRFRQADFKMRSTIIERFGKKAFPEYSNVQDWPVDYYDLLPYYEKVERELGVSGKAGNINGKIIEGGNPFESPRRDDYPMPPLKAGAADHLFVKACKELGYHPFPQATAINSVPYNGRPACTYCGFCHGFPCHNGAKGTTKFTHLAKALATGNLEIRPFARVYRVNRGPDKRVKGVSYWDAEGKNREIEAEIVVLGCYSLENTRLLLVSGINSNGMVGKYFSSHNFAFFTGVLPEYTNPFMGPLTTGSVIDDFNAELIPDEWFTEKGVIWGTAITSWAGDYQPIEAAHNLPPTTPRWGKGFKEWFRNNYRKYHSIYSQTSSLPDERFYCDLDPDVKDPYGQPALRITHSWVEHDFRMVELMLEVKRKIARAMGMTEFWHDGPNPFYHLSTHETGTHRMGDDPKTSVVNRFGEVHECPGLFAIGGGQFPNQPGYNPTGTIMALAYMTADHILQTKGAGRITA